MELNKFIQHVEMMGYKTAISDNVIFIKLILKDRYYRVAISHDDVRYSDYIIEKVVDKMNRMISDDIYIRKNGNYTS